MKRLTMLLAMSCSLLISTDVFAQLPDQPVEQGKFKANWESLSQWECPDWFRDAKFGIWAHWGPQCQAEYGDWYARGMYLKGDRAYKHHVATYGDPSQYGLKELCRDWKAQNWNPDELVKLYKDAGAQYFFTLGQHHDNFDLWDSPYQEWNSVNIGPKKDIVKGWADACKKYGLRFGISMHGSHTWTWLEGSQDFDGKLTKEDGKGQWWEGYDPQALYAQNHEKSKKDNWDWQGTSQPDQAYKMKFQNRVIQCINEFNPDIVYYDDTVLPFWGADEQIGLNLLAHYYNHSANQHGGQQQVVCTGKVLRPKHKQAMLWDVERGVPDRCQELPWQTCTCIGSWHYDRTVYDRNGYKSAGLVIRMLVDIVSKNGNLLLSVPVRAYGTIDEKERAIVMDIKAWMDINKESIYGTRPWKTFGEGPSAEDTNPLNEQGFNEGDNYSNKDVRYNAKNGTVYATIMRWPAASEFTFKAFSIAATSYSGKVTSVKLLGYGDVDFKYNDKGLTVQIPTTHPNEIAPVFAITTDAATISYDNLKSLIRIVEKDIKAHQPANNFNTGKNSPLALSAITRQLKAAKQIKANAPQTAVEKGISNLRTAYADYRANVVNKGIDLTLDGIDITVEKLVETTRFSRADNSTTRFATPKYWTVENFALPQNNSNGTKNGIDNNPGQDCLMIGTWSGEDAEPVTDLSNTRIYRKVTLEPGTYFFAAEFNNIYTMNKGYMFASTKLTATDQIPEKSMASYPISGFAAKQGKFQGIEFTLKKRQTLYLGWQADLSQMGSQEMRVKSVRLIKR